MGQPNSSREGVRKGRGGGVIQGFSRFLPWVLLISMTASWVSIFIEIVAHRKIRFPGIPYGIVEPNVYLLGAELGTTTLILGYALWGLVTEIVKYRKGL